MRHVIALFILAISICEPNTASISNPVVPPPSVNIIPANQTKNESEKASTNVASQNSNSTPSNTKDNNNTNASSKESNNATNKQEDQNAKPKEPPAPIDDFDFNNAPLKISGIRDFVWCGSQDVILILSKDGHLFRSTNGGITFTLQNKDLIKKALNLVEETENVGSANALRYNQNENNPILILFGTTGISWTSRTCGSKWKAINTEKQISSINFHPFQSDYIIGSVYNPNCTKSKKQAENDDNDYNNDDESEEEEEEVAKRSKKSSSTCDGISDLYLTKDDGDTWNKITNGVFSYDWGVRSINDTNNSKVPEFRIIVSKRDYIDGENRLKMEVSDDFFKTIAFSKGHINDFQMENHLIFVSMINDYKELTVSLEVSLIGKQYSFSPIMLPDNTLKIHKYQIYPTDSNGIFIMIKHEKQNNYGNLYKSDINGKYYSLSLKKIIMVDGEYQIKFIEGSEGVIIANVLQSSKINTHNRVNTERLFMTIEFKSYISFNMGGKWSLIKAPTGGENGCSESASCSLHFSYLEYIKSSPTAHGIIFAYGQTGKSDFFDRSFNLGTYLSRDGGKSWLKTSSTYKQTAIGDHGALLCMLNKTQLMYSWDEGDTWEKQRNANFLTLNTNVTGKSYNINKFIPFPESVTQKFIIVSSYVDTDATIITQVNFEPLHERACSHSDDIESEESDYELWSISDEDQCTLGHQISYLKRKQNAKCYNGEQFEQIRKYKNCTCTSTDYECDYGFKRSTGGVCEKDPNIERVYGEECKHGFKEYQISNGYRKITGDTCKEGVSYSITTVKCSMLSLSYSKILMVIILIGAIALLVYKREKAVELLKKAKGKICKRQARLNQYIPESEEEIKFKDEEKSSLGNK